MIIFCSDNGPFLDDGYKDDAVTKLGDHKPAGRFAEENTAFGKVARASHSLFVGRVKSLQLSPMRQSARLI